MSNDNGSNGNGSAPPNGANSGGEPPVGLTEDKVNELINKALSPRFRALEEKQTKALEGFASKFTGDFGALLESKLEALKPPAGDEGKNSKTDPKETPEYRALQKQIEGLSKKAELAETEKKAERAKARGIALRSQVEEELKKAGIAHTSQAAGYLIDTLKAVDFEADDSDNIVFRKKGSDVADLLDQGIGEWAKSAEGKLYQPASGASGSGERPPAGGGGLGSRFSQPQNGQPPSKAELGNALLRLSLNGGQ